MLLVGFLAPYIKDSTCSCAKKGLLIPTQEEMLDIYQALCLKEFQSSQ
jgi:hypothetical protein